MSTCRKRGEAYGAFSESYPRFAYDLISSASPMKKSSVAMKSNNSTVSIATAPQGLLTRAQVAHLFGVCKETIRRWGAQGLFRLITSNGRVFRHRMADVQAVIGNN